nr:hypothetical protein [Tanacetum cinerariifolium]
MQLRPAYNARNVRRCVLDDRLRPVSANDAQISQPLATRSVEPSCAPIEGLCEKATGTMVVIDNVPVEKASTSRVKPKVNLPLLVLNEKEDQFSKLGQERLNCRGLCLMYIIVCIPGIWDRSTFTFEMKA